MFPPTSVFRFRAFRLGAAGRIFTATAGVSPFSKAPVPGSSSIRSRRGVRPSRKLVRHYPIRSLNVIAHIRKATQGATGLENTHPFMRELWGRYWIFAHNGNLVDYAPDLDGNFLPVGQTDSERAFCHLLQTLRRSFPDGMPDREDLCDALDRFAEKVRGYGPFNFLLSNGDCLFAHRATELHYIIRQAPFPVAHLKDEDLSVDFNEVTTPDDRVALIATVPLTDNEVWTPLPIGRVAMFLNGECLRE